ncbi:MAG: response regulator [Oscillatoriales cyanobacterium]|uniref:response regulator n=1 Tax=unclassified Microcoleus TaxID=2642155 RepID=UPI0034594B3E|nr:MAG: response regulator [Oscillatoriales cyanobacterium]
MSSQQIVPPTANILVVDDTPANLRLLAGILTEQGYNVRPARDGNQAISIAQTIALDLILLDINMPVIDGYQVCEKLKADDRTRGIPVIFISALSDVLDKIKAFGVGGVDYITKPFQVEEVLARVATHLSLQNLQNNLQSKNDELAETNERLNATLLELKGSIPLLQSV